MRDLFNLMIMFSRAGLLISPNSYPTLSTQTTRPARFFYFGLNTPFRAVNRAAKLLRGDLRKTG